ncbi:MAG: glycosyltransferase family 4 protein [Marinilabiliaceae bacterium]|nr:glycosyltransferase family 4 protein [Marinilabiliaceae bacterium]
MKKPKLIFYGVKYFPSQGGTSRVVENIIKNLKDKYDITILCYRNSQAPGYMPGIKVIQFSDWPGGSPGALFYFLRSALYLLLFKKFDLIHIHKIDAALFIPWFYKKSKVIATSHESAYLRDKWSKIERQFLLFSEHIFIKSKATVTCISNPLTVIYKEKYGRDVIYIPNGITIKNHYKEEKAQQLLKKYNLSENQYLFFAARRIMKTKGCHTMLEALNRINFKGKIVIAGDLSHAPGYVKVLQTKYTNLDTIYTGYIGDLPLLLTLIKKAQYFIFPSETEGMSIMLLEAASTLTPIICSDIKENREVFNDQHLTFFENMNPDDLGDKINQADSAPLQLKTKAEAALTHIKNKYCWENIADMYHQLYQQELHFN